MCFGKNADQNSFTFEDLCLTNSNLKEILGVIIENKINFNNHVKNSVKKLIRKSVFFSE